MSLRDVSIRQVASPPSSPTAWERKGAGGKVRAAKGMVRVPRRAPRYQDHEFLIRHLDLNAIPRGVVVLQIH
jgi:hypothetical protein